MTDVLVDQVLTMPSGQDQVNWARVGLTIGSFNYTDAAGQSFPSNSYENAVDVTVGLYPDSSGVPDLSSPIAQSLIPHELIEALNAGSLPEPVDWLITPGPPTSNGSLPQLASQSASYAGVINAGQIAIAVGGETSDSVFLASVYVASWGGTDLAQWLAAPALPTALAAPGLAYSSAGGYLLIVGGSTAADTWSSSVMTASLDQTGTVGAWQPADSSSLSASLVWPSVTIQTFAGFDFAYLMGGTGDADPPQLYVATFANGTIQTAFTAISTNLPNADVFGGASSAITSTSGTDASGNVHYYLVAAVVESGATQIWEAEIDQSTGLPGAWQWLANSPVTTSTGVTGITVIDTGVVTSILATLPGASSETTLWSLGVNLPNTVGGIGVSPITSLVGSGSSSWEWGIASFQTSPSSFLIPPIGANTWPAANYTSVNEVPMLNVPLSATLQTVTGADAGPNDQPLTVGAGMLSVTSPAGDAFNQAAQATALSTAGGSMTGPSGTTNAQGAVTGSAFTAECLYSPSAADVSDDGEVALMGRFTTSEEWFLLCDAGVLYAYWWDSDNTQHTLTGPTLTAGDVYAVALVWSGSELYLFVNGTLEASAAVSSAATPSTQGLVLLDADTSIGGVLDEVRISFMARYTTTYTPATEPFTSDSDTGCLYHLDSLSFHLVLTASDLTLNNGVNVALINPLVTPDETLQLSTDDGTAWSLSGEIITGTITAGSCVITGITSTAGLRSNMPIVGAGIPPGTTVKSGTSTTLTMSNKATATATESVTVGCPGQLAVCLFAGESGPWMGTSGDQGARWATWWVDMPDWTMLDAVEVCGTSRSVVACQYDTVGNLASTTTVA